MFVPIRKKIFPSPIYEQWIGFNIDLWLWRWFLGSRLLWWWFGFLLLDFVHRAGLVDLQVVLGDLPVKLKLPLTPSTGELELHNFHRVLVWMERLREPPVETEVEEESSVREKI